MYVVNSNYLFVFASCSQNVFIYLSVCGGGFFLFLSLFIHLLGMFAGWVLCGGVCVCVYGGIRKQNHG